MKKTGDTGDKRTWYIGGKEVNQGRDAERYKDFGRRKPREQLETADERPVEAPTVSSPATNDLMASLAGLDLSSPVTELSKNPLVDTPTSMVSSPTAITPTARSRSASSAAPPVPTSRKSTLLTHGADKWLARLLYNNEGVLYEDAQLQIGLKSEWHQSQARIALYFGNKIAVALDSFTATVDNDDPDALEITLPKIPPARISPRSQIEQQINIECLNLFTTLPVLKVSYLAGSLQTINLRLPIFLTKFLAPVQLDQTGFFERWKQIGGPPREQQKVFPIVLGPDGKLDSAKQRKVISGTRFGVLDGIDPNPLNVVAAGVLHMSNGGKVGCLLRLEPNTQAKVSLSPRRQLLQFAPHSC